MDSINVTAVFCYVLKCCGFGLESAREGMNKVCVILEALHFSVLILKTIKSMI